jgi:3-oxocholest-4-en-26-oyl-CoA dehydrogenase alpha subunit
MELELDSEERRWRAEVQSLAAELDWDWMQRIRAEMSELNIERYSIEFLLELGRRGLIGFGFPEPYGENASALARFVFQEELEIQGLPSYGVTQNESPGHQLLGSGTPELVREHLPHIIDGSWRYAGGLSEPDAGSDLFALRTSAVLEDGVYRVNGAKLWTSGAHVANWISTVVRTTPGEGPRGLSLLMIPLDAPGVTVQPVQLMGGWQVNACYFDDVLVPASNLIGEEGKGLQVLGRALDKERAMSFGGTETRLLANRIIHRFSGRADELGEDHLVTLGRFVAQLEADRMLYLRVAAQSARGEDTTGTAPMNKVFGSELAQRFAEWASDALGPDALWAHGECTDPLAEEVEQQVRTATVLTIIGGTSEIQRNTVATRHLGLPKGS